MYCRCPVRIQNERNAFNAECRQGGKKERDQVLFIAYIQVIWANYCDYLPPLAVQGLRLGSLNGLQCPHCS